ncbi:hypothetical protein BDW62DRAFT_13937 [Aspergillus aurantiobrunneus]
MTRGRDETDDGESEQRRGSESKREEEQEKDTEQGPSFSMASGSAGVGDPASLGDWAADHMKE